MINLNSIHLVEVVYLIEHKALVHLPHLHVHLCVDADGHQMIALQGAPADVLDIDLLMQLVREYHFWGAVLVIVAGLLLAAVVVVPHEHLPIGGGGHKEILAGRRPFYLSHRALMIGQVVNEVLGHPHVPDVQNSRLLTARGKEVLRLVIEGDGEQVIL